MRPTRTSPRFADAHTDSELERRVQRLHRALDVVLVHHARDADGRRADHLDVDAFGRERLEHLGGDAGVRLHARADERDPTDLLVGAEPGRLGLDDDLLHLDRRQAHVVARQRERDVGVALGRHVLHDHVDVDAGVGERAEHRCRDTRAVGHLLDRDLGLGDVVRDTRDDRLLHCFVLLGDPRSGCPREARTNVDLHAVVARELDRSQREHPAAGRGHLQHLVERDVRELARARDDARVGGVDAFDVGVDLADVGAERRRQRDRGGVGAAAAERGDVLARGHALEAGDDRDLARRERVADPVGRGPRGSSPCRGRCR